MTDDMELRRRTWLAAFRLAVVASVVAVAIAIAASSLGNIPDLAIVLPLIVAAFVASWVQTGRVRGSAAQGDRHHRHATTSIRFTAPPSLTAG